MKKIDRTFCLSLIVEIFFMIEITKKEINILMLNTTRLVIKSKSYNTRMHLKIVKKYWDLLNNDTKKIIKTEINGRIKQLNDSIKDTEKLHYLDAYQHFLNDISEKNNATKHSTSNIGNVRFRAFNNSFSDV
ncbi:hypothetical protein [Pasteurella multocida]|uniref:hypothetical protein n=1 Tax=Pasteurella multocida TaxID=747 RepID=UPI00397D8625